MVILIIRLLLFTCRSNYYYYYYYHDYYYYLGSPWLDSCIQDQVLLDCLRRPGLDLSRCFSASRQQ